MRSWIGRVEEEDCRADDLLLLLLGSRVWPRRSGCEGEKKSYDGRIESDIYGLWVRGTCVTPSLGGYDRQQPT